MRHVECRVWSVDCTMKKPKILFTHTGKLNIFPMDAPWRYVEIPDSKVPNVPRGGWRSVRVEVMVGRSVWRTSIFPHQGIHFIPMKRAACEAEGLVVGRKVKMKYRAVAN